MFIGIELLNVICFELSIFEIIFLYGNVKINVLFIVFNIMLIFICIERIKYFGK